VLGKRPETQNVGGKWGTDYPGCRKTGPVQNDVTWSYRGYKTEKGNGERMQLNDQQNGGGGNDLDLSGSSLTKTKRCEDQIVHGAG